MKFYWSLELQKRSQYLSSVKMTNANAHEINVDTY